MKHPKLNEQQAAALAARKKYRSSAKFPKGKARPEVTPQAPEAAPTSRPEVVNYEQEETASSTGEVPAVPAED